MKAATVSELALRALAELQAHNEHTHRLAEIAAMAPLLARLDPFLPIFKERGLRVPLYSLRLDIEHTATGQRRKRLRLCTDGVLDHIHTPARWLDVLRTLGFVEVSRTDGAYGTITLRHGAHLWLVVDKPRTLHEAHASAEQYAQRLAADVARAAEAVPA